MSVRGFILLPLVAGVSACSVATTTTPHAPPSLMPPGMAVAVQRVDSSEPVAGRLEYITASKVVISDPSGRPWNIAREDVRALYQRPAPRAGIPAFLGAAAGAVLGYWASGRACDEGRLRDCGSDRYGDADRRSITRAAGAVVGGVFVSVVAQSLDGTSQGMDPSNWQEISWPDGRGP